MITELIGRVAGGQDLSMEEMTTAVDQIMQGRWDDEQIGLLLTALRAKGETVAEVAGAAAAMRRHMTVIPSERPNLLDTCGTGGDGSGTFNISTAAALVTAAAGVPVAKHGNRAISSKTGSADVLTELGVNIEASIDQVEACLEEVGICFCFAPLMHHAMKHVAAVRKKLGVPTIFNLLGPLCNPARAPLQLLGVGNPHVRPMLASALALLGTRRALVVCGEDGVDEVTLGGTSHVTEVVQHATCDEFSWHPNDFGLVVAPTDDMLVSGPAQSAAVIQGILAGSPGAARDVVVLNAAAALWLAEQAETPSACAALAAQAIDSGRGTAIAGELGQSKPPVRRS